MTLHFGKGRSFGHLNRKSQGGASASPLPTLAAFSSTGNSSSYDNGSTGRWMRYGGAAGSHVGYLKTSGGAITIISQQDSNGYSVDVVALETVNSGRGPDNVANTQRILRSSGGATAPSGDYYVVFAEAGVTPNRQVNYTIRPAITTPASSLYVASWGDSLIAQNATGAADKKQVYLSNSGAGQDNLTSVVLDGYIYDAWSETANTLDLGGGADYYYGSSGVSRGGATISQWLAQTDSAIALCPDLLRGCIGVNSLSYGQGSTLAGLVFQGLDAFHAAAPSVPVVWETVSPVTIFTAVDRDILGLIELNTALISGAASRSWLTLIDTCNASYLGDFGSAAYFWKTAFSSNPVANNTITINGVTVTFKSSGATGAQQANIGASAAATVANLAALINANPGTYGTVKARQQNCVTTNVAFGFYDTTGATITVSTTGSFLGAITTNQQIAAKYLSKDDNFIIYSTGLSDYVHRKHRGTASLVAQTLPTLSALISGGVPMRSRGNRLASMTSAARLLQGTAATATGANNLTGQPIPNGWINAGGTFASSVSTAVSANAETGGNLWSGTITPSGTAQTEAMGIFRSFAIAAGELLEWQFFAQVELSESAAWQLAHIQSQPGNNSNAYIDYGYASGEWPAGTGAQRLWIPTFVRAASDLGATPTSSVLYFYLNWSPKRYSDLGLSTPLSFKLLQVEGRCINNSGGVRSLHG